MTKPKPMQRLTLILLCAVMVFTTAACSNQEVAETAADAADSSAAEETAEPTATPLNCNPLTGEETAYPGYRPVAVALQNSAAAMPQWGISRSGLLIEGLTEGKNTSLTAVFANDQDLPKVGPVAPARDLSLQLLLPLNAIPVHNGINIYASNLLNYLCYQDLNGTYIGTVSFDYDNDRHTSGSNNEFCWYTNAGLVQNGLATYSTPDQGELVSLFRFADTASEPVSPATAARLSISYSDTAQTVFLYNAEAGNYSMCHGDESPWMDADSGEQVTRDNIIILYASAGVKDDGYTRDYDLSSGVGLVLTKGGLQEILWQKNGTTGQLYLYDTSGNELEMNKGTSYIGIYGGFSGQSISVQDESGAEVALPEAPAPMETSSMGESQAVPGSTEEPADESADVTIAQRADVPVDLNLFCDAGYDNTPGDFANQFPLEGDNLNTFRALLKVDEWQPTDASAGGTMVLWAIDRQGNYLYLYDYSAENSLVVLKNGADNVNQTVIGTYLAPKSAASDAMALRSTLTIG